MKIYTKTGDAGETGLFGGARVSKADARVETYGEVDELNSVLGAVRAQAGDAELDGLLHTIQGELFVLGAELARAPGKDLARSTNWNAICPRSRRSSFRAAQRGLPSCTWRGRCAGERNAGWWRSPRSSRYARNCFAT
jgi:cob(I)alamin adenosyltransferase